jgi:RHS repeat-associated protein
VTHTYTYDFAGRLAADTVSNFGNLPAAAQTVNEIATTYDDLGRVETVTSYGSGQTVVNQVKEAYDGWGDLSRQWQSPTGVVTNATPSVQYVYADGSQGGVAAYLRLTDVIYPNGRDVQYGYGTAGSTDDVLGQVATIAGSDGTYAAYTYLGLDTIVTEDYQQPQVKLDYTNGSGQITGLDRFGRVVDQVWSDYGNSTTADEFKYGYDMSGNVAWKENVVSGSQSSPVHLDELYGYNALSELTGVNRGELNTTHDGIETGTLDYSQSWTLDGLGNWLGFNDNGASQTRQVDQSNEITSITGDTVNYDLAGNMTMMPQPGSATVTLTCVYDAWDRLVQVSNGTTVLAQYQYDGADRLVSETASGTTIYSFYAGENVIETRVGGTAASNVQYQYVWSLRGDAIPILRDTYSGGQLQSASRIYYTTDANSNVTALIGLSSGTWVVVERYVYDAYGTVTYYAHDWSSSSTDPQSSINAPQNTLLYAGLALDPLTGLQHADFRWYNSALATWTAEDPIGYFGSGPNLYGYCGDSPTNWTDPTGLDAANAATLLPGLRTWNSKGYATMARLVSISADGNTVTLKKADGTEVNVPVSILSPADRNLVAGLTAMPANVTFDPSATDTYRETVITEFAELSTTTEGRALLDEIAQIAKPIDIYLRGKKYPGEPINKNPITIVPTTGDNRTPFPPNARNGHPSDCVEVHINSTNRKGDVVQSGSRERSPYVGLFKELEVARNFLGGVISNHDWQEENSRERENKLRKELELPLGVLPYPGAKQ